MFCTFSLTFTLSCVPLLFVTTTSAPTDLDRAEQRLAMLHELAEVGMTLVRSIAGQAAAGPICGELGLLYCRVARAVRQTLALEVRFEGEVLVERGREAAVRGAAVQPGVAPVMERERETDGTEPDDPVAETEFLFAERRERLADPEDADFADRPLAEIVERICRDLGVAYDPCLWAEEEEAREGDATPSPATVGAFAIAPGPAVSRGWPPDTPIAASG